MAQKADYTHMRCLYCGKELALLKRLRGGGEFCSEAHKQRYQEEYDKIALSRLLQAQKKAPTASAEPAPPPVAPPTPLAVEESPAQQSSSPVIEQLAASEEQPAAAGVEAPLGTATFVIEKPGAADLPEDEPYLETWLEAAHTPAIPKWAFEPESCRVSTAAVVPLKSLSKGCDADYAVSPANFIAQGLPPENPRPSVPSGLTATTPLSHPLPVGGIRTVEVTPRALEIAASGIRTVDFRMEVTFGESALWSRVPAGVEFPAEDSDVAMHPSWNTGQVLVSSPAQPSWDSHASAAALEQMEEPLGEVPAEVRVNGVPANRVPADEERATPHATLEALSRLHQVMTLQPAAPPSFSEPAVADAVVQVQSPAPEEAERETSAPEEPEPRGANELLDIPIRPIAPSKRSARVVNTVTPAVPAQVPRLKALPLRPKVAPAPSNSVPEAQTRQNVTPTTPTKPPAQTNAPAKGSLTSKPEQPGSNPKSEGGSTTPVSKAAPVSPVSKVAPVPKAAPTSKATTFSKTAPSAKSAEPQQPGRTSEPANNKTMASTQATNPAEGAKGATVLRTGQPGQPPAKEPVVKAAGAGIVKQSEPPKTVPSDEALPSFGSIGRSATPWGSVKIKAGIAIVLVAGACAVYFGSGGKSQKTAVSGTTASADGAGPSIILGEGGWVVGWGGDSAETRSGREITIYRPSVKLSNYRIEFQGDIETSSMGWVFRASDPENYYATKLTMVSTGVSPKVALFKYIVAKGRQTQVGRVPIDMEVRNDTVFKVRVDVRGPKFSTFVQGQPVDVWTDDQLKTGGVGFLNERGERGRIKSVSIRYLAGDDK